MGLYLPVKAKGSAAIAVCPRCNMKVYYDDLKQDPNNKNWYCEDCVDIYDPWRLPARQAEDITLQHPRPDEELAEPGSQTHWDGDRTTWDYGLTIWDTQP